MRTPKIDSEAPAAKLAPSIEQRRHPRRELALRCWIGDARHTLYARLHDVSRGGLSVRAPVPFSPSSTVEVALELPGGRRVRARGEIVWVRDAPGNGPRMGARFTEFVDGGEALDALLGHA
jgi:hypothetical protein